jgi:CRP/FNR family cyclic AMP-dependent transcriptional regulator
VAQGEDCSDIHYVESGLVKLALVSKRGKGAVLGILGQGDFFGEACIGGDTVYSTSAIALVPTCISVMPGRAMLRTLKEILHSRCSS